MTRIIDIEHRLRRWAQALVAGDASGYPSMSVIHPEWQPPSPGVTPTLKISATADVKETHRAVLCLVPALQATLLVHYVLRWPLVQQAEALQCQERTVYERVAKAHRALLEAMA